MEEQTYRVAPPGFTPAQWKTFNEDGIIFIEDAISDEDIQRYIDGIDRAAEAHPKYTPGGYFGVENIVERDPVFTELIDHRRHVGFAYDLFGELLKLHQSQFFLRPPGGKQYNQWHPDGARALPYGVFSPQLPLQIKIGYWLTDLPTEKMGNLVVLPSSHRHQYMDGYDTHKSIHGEKVICLRKDTITVLIQNNEGLRRDVHRI